MDVWNDFESGKILHSALFTELFKRFFSLNQIEVDVEQFNAYYLDVIGQYSYMIEGASDICQALTKYCSMVILTNGYPSTHYRRVKNSPLSSLIDQVIATYDYGYAKPDKRAFDIVFQLYPQISRDSILMVGDGLKSDVMGGINANIDTCWFNPLSKENTLAVSPTYTISNLLELIPIVLTQ